MSADSVVRRPGRPLKVRDLLILVAIAAWWMALFRWFWPPSYRAFGAVDCGTPARASELRSRLPELLRLASEDPGLKALPAAPNLSYGLKVHVDRDRPHLLLIERYAGDSTADLAVASAVMHTLNAENAVLKDAATRASRVTGRPPTAYLGSATLISSSRDRVTLLVIWSFVLLSCLGGWALGKMLGLRSARFSSPAGR
jgi:hypothetical protein